MPKLEIIYAKPCWLTMLDFTVDWRKSWETAVEEDNALIVLLILSLKNVTDGWNDRIMKILKFLNIPPLDWHAWITLWVLLPYGSSKWVNGLIDLFWLICKWRRIINFNDAIKSTNSFIFFKCRYSCRIKTKGENFFDENVKFQ